MPEAGESQEMLEPGGPCSAGSKARGLFISNFVTESLQAYTCCQVFMSGPRF